MGERWRVYWFQFLEDPSLLGGILLLERESIVAGCRRSHSEVVRGWRQRVIWKGTSICTYSLIKKKALCKTHLYRIHNCNKMWSVISAWNLQYILYATRDIKEAASQIPGVAVWYLGYTDSYQPWYRSDHFETRKICCCCRFFFSIQSHYVYLITS